MILLQTVTVGYLRESMGIEGLMVKHIPSRLTDEMPAARSTMIDTRAFRFFKMHKIEA